MGQIFHTLDLPTSLLWKIMLHFICYEQKEIKSKKLLSQQTILDQQTLLGHNQLSKPNATQLNTTLKQLALELDIVVTCTPPHPTHPTTTNFSATSRPARELKFGTDTH